MRGKSQREINMTKYAITEAIFDHDGEAVRMRVKRIVGGNAGLPWLADGDGQVLDHSEVANLCYSDDVYVLRRPIEGQQPPPHRAKVYVDPIRGA